MKVIQLYSFFTKLKDYDFIMKQIQSRMSDFLEYGLAVLLLLNCSSIYNGIPKCKNLFYIFIFVFLLLILMMRFPRTIKKGTKFFVTYAVYFSLLILVSVLNKGKDSSFYIRFFVFIPLFIYISTTNSDFDKSCFLLKIENVIIILAASSLILWILGPLSGILHPTGTINIKWGSDRSYTNYFYLLFTHSKFSSSRFFSSTNILANLLIYPESPFASLIFILGLTIELLCSEKKINWKKTILLIIADITTCSTTGIILIMIVLSAKYFIKEISKNQVYTTNIIIKKFLLPLVLLIILCIGVYTALEIKKTNHFGSFSSHLNAFGNGMEAFLEKPFTGYGYSYNEDKLGNTTSGFFRVLTAGGIFFGILYLIPFIVGITKSIKNKYYNSAVMIGICFILLVLVIWQNSLLLLYLMCMFVTIDKGIEFVKK